MSSRGLGSIEELRKNLSWRPRTLRKSGHLALRFNLEKNLSWRPGTLRKSGHLALKFNLEKIWLGDLELSENEPRFHDGEERGEEARHSLSAGDLGFCLKSSRGGPRRSPPSSPTRGAVLGMNLPRDPLKSSMAMDVCTLGG